LARLGRPEGALLLRSKLLQGDRELEVISECFRSILALEPPREACAFVARFLASEDASIAEAAALSLGESRFPAAFPVLRERWDETFDRSFRRVLLIAMALLRSGEATDFLLSLVSSGGEGSGEERARSALTAIGPFLYVEELRQKARAAVMATGNPKLIELYEEELRKITIPSA
ncbi:MAG: hypothetical protein ACRD21_25085, partial [Vicinamibacteria bacterium]